MSAGTAGWELGERHATAGGVVRWARMGKGEPVVLLHGTPFSSAVWRDIAAALARTHQVYVWDMLGYGQSEMRAGQDVSLAAQQGIFASLLEHWGLDEPTVIAHDFGGAVALRAHLLSGVRYRALALVDPVALAPWGSPFFRLVRDNATVFGQLPAGLHAALVREYVNSASGPGLHPAALGRLVQPWLEGEGQAAFYRQIAQADQRYTDEIEPRYAEIDLPVLVCWGEDDTWIPVAKGEQLADAIPGARLRRIPGAGHLVQEDAPAELTAALVEFLGER
ncbi:Pimeloyl-ACP methyl ester carboxylesterase [Amycolatopsis marina]|uniref:Pimeloyl-ACP methyl ester carboxylesterase n=1 Tax=Amycolatopsis marina TaxID=490629 RepID=A0A1I0YSC1_9PSEU|nr:alpha/beta hydrolase [Amycolatopsis marina]SFB16091.1 Pimeloyl-ACP methyl ester carboxylesterase [Amycolatopsis marina]